MQPASLGQSPSIVFGFYAVWSVQDIGFRLLNQRAGVMNGPSRLRATFQGRISAEGGRRENAEQQGGQGSPKRLVYEPSPEPDLDLAYIVEVSSDTQILISRRSDMQCSSHTHGQLNHHVAREHVVFGVCAAMGCRMTIFYRE